ncbi:unnamed protein product [Rotaria sp. Silwood1]|nr:unnamed protein product [Rotaria sp. Silwood1]CAF1068546.1 unnamed protein product [Rotaria sp. Silwood1]CAF3433990.1 unnamed protein product [Rotaria sp. Silwood1]CAF4613623.1 unnamed protein product [Rotaria sp. Silwood1]CAF4793992.1 unnamed protein product [Rotaria sp. Silwood1]
MNNMIDKNINLMSNNKNITVEQEEQWNHKSLDILNMKRNLFINICQSSSIFFILIIITIIPISQVFVGWHYSNACPINQSIPYYLTVAGFVGLVLVILIFVSQLMARTFARKMFDDVIDRTNQNRTTILFGCGVCSIMCINLSLFIFLLGWSIIGWIWVLGVWHKVQYYHVTDNDYCHPILYKFTFSLLLLTISFQMILFSFVCRKTCVRITNVRRKDTIATDES